MKRSTMLGGRYSVVAVISAMLLFSCSQLEDIHPDAIQDNQIEATADGFKLTPLGGMHANLRVYEDVDCNDYCITEDASSWVVKNTIYKFNNQFWIDMKVYNTPEEIVYNFEIKAGNNSNPTIAFINGQEVNAATFEIRKSLEEGWEKCNTIEEEFVIIRSGGGQGQGNDNNANTITINSSYDLFEVCEVVSCEEFMIEAIEGMENAYRFTYISNEALEDVTIQMTLPQIADWEALDGKSYEEFGNGANGGIRWTGDLAACGDGITFELQFKPACEVSNSNSKGNKNTTPSSVNLMTNFVVQGGDFGGNKLKNNITASCN